MKDKTKEILTTISIIIFLILFLLAIAGGIWQYVVVAIEKAQEDSWFLEQHGIGAISLYMSQNHLIGYHITNIIDLLTIIWGIITLVILTIC